MEGGAGDDDWACPPRWVSVSRGSGMKRVKPVEESSDESEVCKEFRLKRSRMINFQL